MSFKAVSARVKDALKRGELEKARKEFDRLDKVAVTREQRVVVHDIGNEIQREILAEYIKKNP